MSDVMKKSNYDIEVGQVSDRESASDVVVASENETVRGLSSRHIQLITFGGGIGTGLFISTGGALSTCGPAPLLMSYMIMSVLVWSLMNQLGEMVSFIPLPGDAMLYSMSRRYSSKSISFAAGWNLFYAQAIIAPAEITACSFVIQYWTDANPAIFISIFCVISVVINFAPVKYFGEAEFWISGIKILCLLGIIIVGIVIFFGGAPAQDHVLGFHYWKLPGAFTEHLTGGNTGKFLAFWTALVKSGFSFVLVPELLTTCASETQNPRKNVPRACGKFFYRLIFFFVMGPLVASVIVAYNDPRLMDAISAGASNAAASPFVIGIQNAGIPVLNHIINACILTSACSAGNAYYYSASRSLYAMALKGDAPKIFAKTNKFGVPIYSVGVTGLFTLLAYLNCSNAAAVVFNWLSNIATISGFVSWIFVSTTYLRYRKAVDVQNLRDRVPYQPPHQKFGAYFCICFFSLLALTNGYGVFFPSNWSVSNFFAAYVTIPIVIVLYAIGRLAKRERKNFYDSEDVNIQDDLYRVEKEQLLYEVDEEPKQKSLFRKYWIF